MSTINAHIIIVDPSITKTPQIIKESLFMYHRHSLMPSTYCIVISDILIQGCSDIVDIIDTMTLQSIPQTLQIPKTSSQSYQSLHYITANMAQNAGEYKTVTANDIDRQLVGELNEKLNSQLGQKEQGYNIIKAQTQLVNGINRRYELLSADGRLPAQITIYTPLGSAQAKRLLGDQNKNFVEANNLGGYQSKVASGADYQRVQENESVLRNEAHSKDRSYVINHVRTQVVDGTNYVYNLTGVDSGDYFYLKVYVPLSKVTNIKQ